MRKSEKKARPASSATVSREAGPDSQLGAAPMSEAHDSTGEQRVNEVIAAYLKAVQSCERPDRDDLLRRHADLAGELRSFFADEDAVLPGAAPLRELATQGPAVPAGPAPVFVRYFGDYELFEEIARGGMGVVYRAKQVSLNRIVALKMILAGQLASDEDVIRFRREAEESANLDHPNIVPIYEVGEHHGQHYFSMKLIEGSNLAEWIRKKFTAENAENAEGKLRKEKSILPDSSLPPSFSALSAVKLLIPVARAVHFAHQRGILHRDLKPANILIDEAGTPYVSDFGLARKVQRDSALTQSGAIVGTPAYMPPEQARAEKLLTTSVDVYALGAILYELLTGRPPFRAATPLDTLLQVLDQEPLPPAELNPNADPDLSAVALKCLEKQPGRRYESAAALAEELERWLAGEPVRARPISRLRRRLRWVQQHPDTMATLVAVSVILPINFTLFMWMGGHISTSAALGLSVMFGLSGLSVLYGMPEKLSRRLVVEERRAVPSAPRQTEAEPIAPVQAALPPVSPTVSEPQRSGLAAVARGAGEGLVVGGLLLAIHFAGIRFRLGRWPDPGVDWYCTYFFQAALMMAVALGGVLGGPTPSRKRGPSRTGKSRLFDGKPVFEGHPLQLLYYQGVLWFLILSCSPDRMGWWFRLFFWLGIAGMGFCVVMFGGMLVWQLVASSRDSATDAIVWQSFRGMLSVVAPFCPAFGFLLGELVAGDVQPAAFTAPLTGAMIGWAAGVVLYYPNTGPDSTPQRLQA
jgi:serine/threonine protein kinase